MRHCSNHDCNKYFRRGYHDTNHGLYYCSVECCIAATSEEPDGETVFYTEWVDTFRFLLLVKPRVNSFITYCLHPQDVYEYSIGELTKLRPFAKYISEKDPSDRAANRVRILLKEIFVDSVDTSIMFIQNSQHFLDNIETIVDAIYDPNNECDLDAFEDFVLKNPTKMRGEL